MLNKFNIVGHMIKIVMFPHTYNNNAIAKYSFMVSSSTVSNIKIDNRHYILNDIL